MHGWWAAFLWSDNKQNNKVMEDKQEPKTLKTEYRIVARLGNKTGNVGAAWRDVETGVISLQFNAFIVLPTDNLDLNLKLVPVF